MVYCNTCRSVKIKTARQTSVGYAWARGNHTAPRGTTAIVTTKTKQRRRATPKRSPAARYNDTYSTAIGT